jgi:hypothetical protein
MIYVVASWSKPNLLVIKPNVVRQRSRLFGLIELSLLVVKPSVVGRRSRLSNKRIEPSLLVAKPNVVVRRNVLRFRHIKPSSLDENTNAVLGNTPRFSVQPKCISIAPSLTPFRYRSPRSLPHDIKMQQNAKRRPQSCKGGSGVVGRIRHIYTSSAL